MVEIHFDNYEVFILDFIEGRLNQQQSAALMAFLKTNPRLIEEMDEVEKFILRPDNENEFRGKEKLKSIAIKPFSGIEFNNYEIIMAAAVENHLLPDQKKQLDDFLTSNPLLSDELIRMQKCVLRPDNSIVFENKTLLKQQLTLRTPAWRQKAGILAVAASIVLLAGLYLLLRPTQTIDQQTTDQPVVSRIQHEDDSAVAMPSLSKTVIEASDVLQPAQEFLFRQTDITSNQLAEKIIYEKPAAEIPRPGRIAFIEPIAFAKVIVPTESNITADWRYEVSVYFNDVMLAQSIRHGEHAGEIDRHSVFTLGGSIIRNIFNPTEIQTQPLINRVKWWELVDAGVTGFTFMTGSDIEFRTQTNEKGKLESFALEGRLLMISHSMAENNK